MTVRRKKRRRRKSPLGRQPDGQLELMFPLGTLDRYARDMIEWRAAQLSYSLPFKPCDRADLAQELATDLIRRAPRWDARKGTWRGFVCRVTKNRMYDLLTGARIQRLGWKCPKFSLNEFIHIAEEGYATREEIMEIDERVDQCHDTWQLTDLRVDLEQALDAMPLLLRTICLRLPNEAPARIARALGLTPPQMRKHLALIRELLTAAGLTDYLPTNPNEEINHEQ